MKTKLMTTSLLLSLLAGAGSLTSCSSKEQVLIYSTGEEERIAFVQEELNKQFPNYDIIIQEKSTAALVTDLQGQGVDTDCDIIHELEITNMEILLQSNPNFFYSLDEYDFNKFTNEVLPYNHKKYAPQCITYCALVYNKSVLQANQIAEPTTYDDLLNTKYKNLISMPNPKTSGTGYAFYNGLVSTLGKTDAMSYFSSLNSNIKEYTTSGSTPIKEVQRGNIAAGFAMVWQCEEYCKANPDMGYTTLNLGCPYNLYDMAVINGHQERPAVKEVFDYIFNDLNQRDIERFIPDPAYKNYTPVDSTYPTNLTSMTMNGIADPSYKTNLLNEWPF